MVWRARRSSSGCGALPADRLRQRDDDRERGAVVVLVLWSMVLVFVLLAAASATSRSEVLIARNTIAESRARHAAEAGTQLGLSRLLRRKRAGDTIFDGTPEEWRDGSTRVAISIVDEAGKIDINQASLELLSGLFVAVGRPRHEALRLACAIVLRRSGGTADCPEVPLATDQPRPPGRRFAVPEELAQLPGFDDRIYAAVADYVTVATGATAVDPLSASRTVLLAIPGATPDLVDTYLSNRAMWHDLVSAGDTMNLLPAAPYLMASPGRDYTIKAVARTAEGARFRADLQLRLTDLPSHPYEIVAWRTPPVGLDQAKPQPRVP
jgi:general secretion pathway protein K